MPDVGLSKQAIEGHTEIEGLLTCKSLSEGPIHIGKGGVDSSDEWWTPVIEVKPLKGRMENLDKQFAHTDSDTVYIFGSIGSERG